MNTVHLSVLWLPDPRWMRVTEERRPKDQSEKGDDSDPGLATRRADPLLPKRGGHP